MKSLIAVIAAAVLLMFTSLAQAAQIASPPLWTAFNTAGACYVRNTGTTAVTVAASLFVCLCRTGGLPDS